MPVETCLSVRSRPPSILSTPNLAHFQNSGSINLAERIELLDVEVGELNSEFFIFSSLTIGSFLSRVG